MNGVLLTPNRAGEEPVRKRGLAAAGSEEPSIARQILQVARRRRWVIIASLGAAIALSIIATLLMTPKYTATTRIEISREGAKVVDVGGVESDAQPLDLEFYQTQYGLLTSEALAQRVAQDLKLTNDDQFFAKFGATSRADKTKGDNVARLRLAGDILLKNVWIAPIRMSRLVDIHAISPDPQLSARIANAWSRNFIQTNLERRFEASSYARKFLESRLEQLRVKLEESERKLVAYASRQNIVNIPGTINRETGASTGERSLVADRASALNEELAKAQAARIEAESRLARFNSKANSDLLQNDAISGLRQRRAELSAEYSKMMVQFAPDYPAAKSLASQIAALDRSIAREEARVGDTYRSAFNSAAAREDMLRSRVNGLETSLTDLRRRSIQYNIYQRDVDTNRQLYDGLLQRYKEVGIAGGVNNNNISIVDPALVPQRPSKPNLMLNLLIGIVAGAVLGAALSWLLEHLNESITDPTEVPRSLGFPLLGTVPSTTEPPSESLQNPRSPMVEAYLAVQTSLEFATQHGLPRSLAVTSTRPMEGKSTSSLALARSFARARRNVLLIDGDMRSPTLHFQFDRSNDVGLSNYLAGNSDLTKSIFETTLPGLSIMAAGPHPPNAADLLAGGRLQELLTELSSRFDIVVIDSPPVMGLADAPLIGSSVEGTVYVVESRSVRRSMVRVALSRLLGADVNLLGIILTKFDAKHAHYGYGYDYGYGYGSGQK